MEHISKSSVEDVVLTNMSESVTQEVDDIEIQTELSQQLESSIDEVINENSTEMEDNILSEQYSTEIDEIIEQSEPSNHEVSIENITKFEENNWVQDSSVDHKGRIPRRSSTGQWKAALFVIGTGIAEKMVNFSISISVIEYLTSVMHQDIGSATKNTTYWIGVSQIIPLVAGFLADAYVGRFHVVLASSMLYVSALLLLIMSQLLPSLKPCENSICHEPKRIHRIVFFISIYLIALGSGGHRSVLGSFVADQFDDNHPQERKKKTSLFKWFNVGMYIGLLIGQTVMAYFEDRFSWAFTYIVLALVMTTMLLLFFVGRNSFRFRRVLGSPLTSMLRVILAAIAKRNLPYPIRPEELHEFDRSDMTRGRLLAHTNQLKFLDKAAIIEGQSPNLEQNLWRLASVTHVEELKLMINMMPICLTVVPFAVCQALSLSLFIKQATAMDINITKDFTIPPASISVLASIGSIFSVLIINKFLKPFLRKIAKKERGINTLQGVGIAMGFGFVAMVTSALVEGHRLKKTVGQASMSVFWLAPQFLILGFGDGFTVVSEQHYLYNQMPPSMRSLGTVMFLCSYGVSGFLCSLMITTVNSITSKAGRSWLGKDLNSSRVDYFYWTIASIVGGSFCIFLVITGLYSYKGRSRHVVNS